MKRIAIQSMAFVFLCQLAVRHSHCESLEKPSASQQFSLPDTPAGRQLSRLLQVYDTGKLSLARAFVKESMSESFRTMVPMEAHLHEFGLFHDLTRGLELISVPECNELAATALVKYRFSGEIWNIRVELESKSSHLVKAIATWPADRPADPIPLPKLTGQQVVDELARYVDKLAQADLFSGVVLLAKADKLLLLKVYGQASKSFSIPNRLDTKFNLGSMNKMFTAVAIAQLVEQGKLSYDHPVGDYLGSDWLAPEIAGKVKVAHLLCHTSGLGNIFTERFQKSSRTLYRAVEDYKPLVADQKLAFEPGMKWQYSNAGFLLLGAIIEKVTGQSYFDYVCENVFEPAGMKDSDSYEMDRPVPNLAIGYDKEFNDNGYTFKNNLFEHLIKGCPAGGGFSTAGDLLKFSEALRSGRLVSAATRDVLLSPKPELNSQTYGYGFETEKEEGLGRIVGHSGGFTGISSRLDMYLDLGYTVAVLSNYSHGSQAIVGKAKQLLRQCSEPKGEE